MRVLNIGKFKYIYMIPFFILLAVGLGFFVVSGFNTGIDFSSGLNLTVQIAEEGFTLSSSEELTLDMEASSLVLTTEDETYKYELTGTIDELVAKINTIDNVKANSTNKNALASSIIYSNTMPLTITADTQSVDIAIQDNVSINTMRAKLKSLDSINVQAVGNEELSTFNIKQKIKGEQGDVESAILAELNKDYKTVVLQSEFVGPKFSTELLRTSIIAIFVAVILIFIYISFRFRFPYAISSIIALVHDVLLMLSFILILRLEVSTTTIAAVLTIIGYSLNNTIVIFDRVRENVRLDKFNIESIIEKSVSQSLTRTIITSLTTLFAVIPLAIFAESTVQLFAINLIWGIIIGTYSSNFVAPVCLSLFHNVSPINKEKKKKIITDIDYIK